MRSGHAATPVIPVLAAGVGVRDAARYAIRLASFRLELPPVGHAALGVVASRPAASVALVGLLTGRTAPSYGQLRVLGHDLRTPAGRAGVRAGIGTATGTGRTWPTMTIRGLVDWAARRSGQPRHNRGLLVAAILDRLALLPWAQVPLHAAPALVARRARLAAACVHEPELLIIDGLFDRLEARDRMALTDAAGELKRDISIIAIERDASSLPRFCDEVLTLAEGILVAPDGPGDPLGVPKMALERHRSPEDEPVPVTSDRSAPGR
ncbi:MAG TPA: hypothetical protein VFQ44_31280 [Streptosporangiaceae bacterium]|nr:hypothetical protein [Streptosporangiaceae bacterium]